MSDDGKKLRLVTSTVIRLLSLFKYLPISNTPNTFFYCLKKKLSPPLGHMITVDNITLQMI